MKMLATKVAIVTSMALATLLATESAYAQRHDAAPQAYDSVDHSRVRGHNFKSDQQIIDEITRNDWNAGR